VVTLLCCVPAGVVAIVFATRVQGLQQMGDVQGALDASQKAKTWCIVSLVLGLVGVALFIGLGVAGAFDSSSSAENGFST
jgi:hypothetical protein